MTHPQLLVVMPLYNALPYVRSALKSILSQTFIDFRLLIINDGSTDGSEQAAAAFDDKRILILNQENQGPGAAMNTAIKYAVEQNIPFLARMDADDISVPGRLETQVRMMEKYPSAAACSGNCYWIDAASGQIIGSSTVSTSPALIRWEIEHGLRGLIQGACLFRTGVLEASGGYRSQFKRAEEVDLFLRLAEQYELRNSGEYLYKIRIHPESYSLKDVHTNTLYQFYALDCAARRREGRPERSFDEFLDTMPWTIKYRVWREEYLLKYWRSHMGRRGLLSLLTAGLIDPRRVWVRVLRKLQDRKGV